MLERKIDNELLKWKGSKSNKACIINGARQVGKTFSVRHFAAKNYKSTFELNFLESPKLKDIFSGALDAKSVLLGVCLNFPNIQFQEGNTLLFLDEIQECPGAITALKFLSTSENFDVIATGSALGMAYGTTSSFPVGSTHNITMHSLSFEEFLWACGIERSLIETLKSYFASKTQVPVAVNNKMLELLREFLVVGGMPEVVQNYVESNDLKSVHELQKNIYSDYVNDIARFSKPDIKIKAERCFKSIPNQLLKENHKFQYSKVERKGTARKFECSLDWLLNAHMAKSVHNVSKIEFPLMNFSKPDNFRIYMNDIGLLVSTFDFSIKRALLNDRSIENPLPHNLVLRTAKGGIYEALAFDLLSKNNHNNIFFYRNNQGNTEIDFLIEGENGVLPLEVKAGAKTKTKSLNKVLESPEISCGYKFGSQNIGTSDKLVTMPLYMLMFV